MPEISIKEALNKAYIKVKPERAAIEKFKAQFITLIDTMQARAQESEEFQKNLVSDFLKKTWFDPDYFINTSGRYDLVIHTEKAPTSSIGVLLEAKRPGNKNEMISGNSLDAKAMHELLLYYLRESIDNKNLSLKHLIITNSLEWFIFDAQDFYKLFSLDKELIKLYTDFSARSLLNNANDFFYTQIAPQFIKKHEKNLRYVHFNIADYETIIRSRDKEADNKLIALYKILSPEHLLKLSFANDSNSLNQNFYSELLYIMGLSEEKENGKKIIVRCKAGSRQEGSLIEKSIFRLADYDIKESELFEYALELVITWINRILFLKLLESQQMQYQKGNPDYAFLHINKIKNYSDLNTLFFSVLAKKPQERQESIQKYFTNIPYLNSSLFEMTAMEKTYFPVALLPDTDIAVYAGTVLKTAGGKKRGGKINALEYMFAFLDAYDFASEGTEEIQEENKSLINASVLGLIFEKINGYKDGSYFTPGFITTYMCREVLRGAVITKFNEAKNWNAKTLDDVYNKIEDINEANNIINSLTICDPAVGSGHFLVSALNEIIAIKSDLGILADSKGKKLKGFKAEIINDELMLFDDEHNFFIYNYKSEESRRVQETIFKEKRRIIENCLFGVDINSNSVKICRLRLWIELLKNAYYTAESNLSELETLPNIDINIKCGNSLVSRYDLDIDIKQELDKLQFSVKEYQDAVYRYKNAAAKDEKAKLVNLIAEMKDNFRGQAEKHSRLNHEIFRLHDELAAITHQELFDLSAKEKAQQEKRIQQIADAITRIEQQMENIRTNALYDNAFEWRFEFPEVLNDAGDFTGFDAVIGNPPYIDSEHMVMANESLRNLYKEMYKTAKGNWDLFIIFIEKAMYITKDKGILSLIIPNKLISQDYASDIRKMISNGLLEIRDFSRLNVFENAAVYPITILIKKDHQKQPVNIVSMTSTSEINETKTIDRKKITDLPWDIFFQGSSVISILGKINKSKKPLKEIIQFESPCTVSEAYKIKSVLADKNKTTAVKKFINSGTIDPYTSFWGIRNTSYIKEKYKYPVVSDRELKELSARRFTQSKSKKIIIANMTQNIEAFLDTKTEYLAGKSTVIALGDDNALLIGAALLNSKLVSFWYKCMYHSTKMSGDALSVTSERLGALPVPEISIDNKNALISLVEKILAAKAANPQADTAALEREIDALVYKLYNLSREEISIIES